VTHQNRLGFVDVQCFPIYSILAALNRTTVDYFSLDIEGDELSILKTIPWDLVDIRVSTYFGIFFNCFSIYF
jgi:Methyltransferase FkbM domain